MLAFFVIEVHLGFGIEAGVKSCCWGEELKRLAPRRARRPRGSSRGGAAPRRASAATRPRSAAPPPKKPPCESQSSISESQVSSMMNYDEL